MSEPGDKEITSRNLAKSTYLKYIKRPHERIEALEKESRIDRVTGLANDNAFFEMLNGLQGKWERDSRLGKYLKGSFIVMDLVGLHATNDKYGRENGGDDYLRAVATSIKETARMGDRGCRMGSAADEFTLYVPDAVTADQLNKIMDRIDSELDFKQLKAQEKYPGIQFRLSYSASAFGPDYSPRAAYNDAANRLGEAKGSVKGSRVGDVGRLIGITYNV